MATVAPHFSLRTTSIYLFHETTNFIVLDGQFRSLKSDEITYNFVFISFINFALKPANSKFKEPQPSSGFDFVFYDHVKRIQIIRKPISSVKYVVGTLNMRRDPSEVDAFGGYACIRIKRSVSFLAKVSHGESCRQMRVLVAGWIFHIYMFI